MKFPKSQSDIARLADMMLKGYFLHSADFPSVFRMMLLFEIRKFENAVKVQLDAVSAFRQESQKKNEKLQSLKAVMRQCLKKSVVDTKDNPEKLLLIGTVKDLELSVGRTTDEVDCSINEQMRRDVFVDFQLHR